MPVVMLLLFALTLFTSASLLFLIEPMIGKMMLPLLGGTPAVWNTCMLFFQAVLLAGYLYAHLTTKYMGPRRQAWLHLGVLVVPILFFLVNGPLTINPGLIEGREGYPMYALLLVLTTSVAIPMFVVCTSASVLQRWFADTDHPSARDPYFLYGASNLGSMLALAAYPFYVERTFTLANQRIYWCIGFGLFAILVALCAWMMWISRRPEDVTPTATPSGSPDAHGEGIKVAQQGVQKGMPTDFPELSERETAPITWLRRLRWTVLAIIPSSLMLGATTYITTDIAAIPLLWVLPLMLYLLTFIFVFAVFSPMTQNISVVVTIWALMGFFAFYLTPMFFPDNSLLRWVIVIGGIGACGWSLRLLVLDDKELIHHVMVMVMPLLVLLLIFIMLAPPRHLTITGKIGLHLATLFVVSMVCHGEMARDRPASKHLTEFFLIMSIGGVLGGTFNALIAPIAFYAIIEYQMMMMVACLIVPALGMARDNRWARYADIALASVFFVVGTLLLVVYYYDFRKPFVGDEARAMEWSDLPVQHWWRAAYALLPGIFFGILAAYQGWGTPPAEEGETPQNSPIDRSLDVILPAGLFVLVLGLYWGLPASAVSPNVEGLAKLVFRVTDFSSEEERQEMVRQLLNILMFGLPAVLCYTFVERSVRFGLGVGAILLASGISLAIKEGVLYQERSYFGVLKVEEWAIDVFNGKTYDVSAVKRYPDRMVIERRLVHGTTLHGVQLMHPEFENIPTSYYHATGPVGRLMAGYNNDPDRAIAVIGLGTGTVAAYGLPKQRLDYFDIDAVVVDIAFDSDEYFTYVTNAEKRGVDIALILGDARLTFDPNNPAHKREGADKGVPRLLPLNRHKHEAPPPRRFGPPLGKDDKYGLIFADAFSSDAIPVHLLTKEAIEIYLRRLEHDGIICVHISNRYLDLLPVLANITTALREQGVTDGRGNVLEKVPNLVGYHMSDNDEEGLAKSQSNWVVIARDKKFISKLWDVPQAESKRSLGLLAFTSFPGPNMQVANSFAHMGHTLADRAESKILNLSQRPRAFVTFPATVRNKEGELVMGSFQLPAEENHWVPLDTLHDIDERNEANLQALEAARKRIRELTDGTDTAQTDEDRFIERGITQLERDRQKFLDALGEAEKPYKDLLQKQEEAQTKLSLGLKERDVVARDAEAKAKALEKALEVAGKLEEDRVQILLENLDIKDLTELKSRIEAEKKKAREARAEEAKLLTLPANVKFAAELQDAKQKAEEAKKKVDAAATPEEEATRKLRYAYRVRAETMEWFDDVARQLDPEAIREIVRSMTYVEDEDGRRRERVRARLNWKPTDRALQKRRDYLNTVGVWTDDYSNLLSVFTK